MQRRSGSAASRRATKQTVVSGPGGGARGAAPAAVAAVVEAVAALNRDVRNVTRAPSARAVLGSTTDRERVCSKHIICAVSGEGIEAWETDSRVLPQMLPEGPSHIFLLPEESGYSLRRLCALHLGLSLPFGTLTGH